MSKNRLLGAAVLVTVVATASVLAMTVTASAKPVKHNADVVKLGFITSEGTEPIRQQASAAGASFLVTKPFTAQDIETALGKALR